MSHQTIQIILYVWLVAMAVSTAYYIEREKPVVTWGTALISFIELGLAAWAISSL